jgi:hypothetical protein
MVCGWDGHLDLPESLTSRAWTVALGTGDGAGVALGTGDGPADGGFEVGDDPMEGGAEVGAH